MKDNILKNIITLAFKYIWILCTVLILAEIIGTTYTANILLKETSYWVMESLNEEITTNINNVRHLLVSMASDRGINDTSIPLANRAASTRAYRDGYGLFMIGVVDNNFQMITTNQSFPNPKPIDVSNIPFITNAIKKGQSQSTDLTISSVDQKTPVINIATPMSYGGIVRGAVVASVYFDNIQAIIDRNNASKHQKFLLLDQNFEIITTKDDFLQSVENKYKTSRALKNKQIGEDIKSHRSGSFWTLGEHGPTLISYSPMTSTNWILVHSSDLSVILISILPMFFLKVFIYIFLCVGIYVFSKMYLQKHLSSVNLLLDKISEMQKEVFQSENADFAEILSLSEQGLTDKLTGLHTRTLAFSLMNKVLKAQNSQGALLFIDFDDLKPINDSFGHSAGDDALIAFSTALKIFLAENDAVLGRYGGDEFVMLIKNINSPKEYYNLVGKLKNQLNISVKSGDYLFSIHASIGGVLYKKEDTDLEDLINKADLALYQAKEYGKNRVYLYSPDIKTTPK